MNDTISTFLANLAESFTTFIESLIVDVAGSAFGVEEVSGIDE